MSEGKILSPCIGGAAKPHPDAKLTKLISPIDETVAAQIVESDAGIVDLAVKNAHGAFLCHRESTVAARIGWVNAPAPQSGETEKQFRGTLHPLHGQAAPGRDVRSQAWAAIPARLCGAIAASGGRGAAH